MGEGGWQTPYGLVQSGAEGMSYGWTFEEEVDQRNRRLRDQEEGDGERKASPLLPGERRGNGNVAYSD